MRLVFVLLEENLISLGHADEPILVFKTLGCITHGVDRDDAAGNHSEGTKAEEVVERGLHGLILPDFLGFAYSCGYANDVRGNQWGYAPRGGE
jgi:hypothetical protein